MVAVAVFLGKGSLALPPYKDRSCWRDQEEQFLVTDD